jgi:hypothetical protein
MIDQKDEKREDGKEEEIVVGYQYRPRRMSVREKARKIWEILKK